MRKRLLINGLLGACAMLTMALSADAQNLVNSSTGQINNCGVVRVKNAAGAINNDNADITKITNTGSIVFEGATNAFGGTQALGSSKDLRVPGKVQFNGTVVQTIPASFFTDLEMANSGQKNFPAGSVYVSGGYMLGSGATCTRNYGSGTFVYDGGAAQDILAENGASSSSNAYNNLTLMNAGVKTIKAGETVNISAVTSLDVTNTGGLTLLGIFNGGTNITQDAAAPIVLNNTAALFNVGKGTNNFNGTVTVTSGEFSVNSGAAAATNINGTLALANDATAKILVDAGNTLTIPGTFTNAFAARTNMTFDGSTVAYTGAANQIMVSTVSTNPYGNLMTSGAGTKTATANGDIYVAGNLSVTGGNIDMYNNADDQTLVLLANASRTVTYDAVTNPEVVGKMRVNTLAADKTYTFNNSETKIKLTGGGSDYFEISSVPATAVPSIVITNFDATRDLKRKVLVDYPSPSTGSWTGVTFRMGYKTSDYDNASWTTNGSSESQLRFYEDASDPTKIEKVATGTPYIRQTTTGTIHYVELTGIQPTTIGSEPDGNPDGTLKSGEVLLRAGAATFISVADGRWSHNTTWDEGEVPKEDDIVLIRTTVHAGYIRANDPTGTDLEATPGKLASKITIDDNLANASLLLGGTKAYGIKAGVNGVTNSGSMTIGRLNGASNVPNTFCSTTDDASSSSKINGGLVLFQGSTLQVRENLNINGLVSNGGEIILDTTP